MIIPILQSETLHASVGNKGFSSDPGIKGLPTVGFAMAPITSKVVTVEI